MGELLRNAWTGWLRVTGDGKLMALFLVALLFLWIGYKREEHKPLLCYGSVMAVWSIFPVTALVSMLYQTKFYDYEWIWSSVPVTVLTAYAGTKVLAECWQGFRREAWKKGLPVTIGLLLVSFLCSGPGGADLDRASVRERQAETEHLLEMVRAEGGEVCLWAPRGIMEHVRDLDSGILLPYGRNMWEEALGAYSYDVYPKDMENMYQWMCIVEESCKEEDMDVKEKMEEQELSTLSCLNAARQAGVNLLVLPDDANQVLLKEVAALAGVQPEQNHGYYIFHL